MILDILSSLQNLKSVKKKKKEVKILKSKIAVKNKYNYYTEANYEIK